MYTELVLGVDLKPDTPNDVIETIRVMVGDELVLPQPVPDHPLFKCERWKFMLVCGSYYFAGPTLTGFKKDEIAKRWQLSVRCNLKNYGGEIEHFLDWIRPYIDKPSAGEFMGYSRYEESDEPTLLYV